MKKLKKRNSSGGLTTYERIKLKKEIRRLAQASGRLAEAGGSIVKKFVYDQKCKVYELIIIDSRCKSIEFVNDDLQNLYIELSEHLYRCALEESKMKKQQCKPKDKCDICNCNPKVLNSILAVAVVVSAVCFAVAVGFIGW